MRSKLPSSVVLVTALVAASLVVTAAAHAAGVTAQSTGTFTAVASARILDTRTTNGGHQGPLGTAQSMTLRVVGMGGIPAAGVSAVLVTVTVLDETADSGYLALYQTGVSRPVPSSVNFYAGVVTANQALVRVGSDGTITIYNSNGNTDVVVDTQGWVGAGGDAATAVTSATPQRLLDTRTTTGGHQAPLSYGQSLNLTVAGVGAIPAAGVAAVFADIIAVPVETADGYLTAYSPDNGVPPTSSVNFGPGKVASSMSLIPVSAGGAIAVYAGTQQVNVVIDIFGWVLAGDPVPDAGLQALPPARILDTRSTGGALSAGQTLTVPVLGKGGVPASGVAAVVAHVTGVTPTDSSYLTVFPSGYPRQSTSLLNIAAGAATSDTIIVPVGPDGAISIWNYASNPNIVVDIQGWVAAPALTVTPPASALTAGALTTTDGLRAVSILDNANRYAVTTWWTSVAPGLLGTPMTNDASASTDSIRRLAMQALSLATALSTGAYDPSYTGVPADAATADTVRVINAVSAGHLSNAAGGWGDTWQSTFYAAYLGTAAWLLWAQLPAQTQTDVARMVYHEADWGMGYRLQYYRNPDGSIPDPADTGADLDSWLPMADQLAVVMMPTNPHVPLWNFTIAHDALAAWARPGDLSSNRSVNGATVATWIEGSNMIDDPNGPDVYLINHDRVAFDYSTLIYQNMQANLLDALAGVPAPTASTALIPAVYNAFTTYTFSGKTTYTPGSAQINYPVTPDWGNGQEIPFALIDAETAAFGASNTTAAQYETLHADAELAMQNSHADGHTYDTDTQCSYIGREEQVAQQAAQLFLTKWVRDHNLAAVTDAPYWINSW